MSSGKQNWRMNKFFRTRCPTGCSSARWLRLVIAICMFAVARDAHAVQAHVEVAVSGANFTYTIFNDEDPGSSLILSAFELQLEAPIQAIQSPPGWTFETDGANYISWISTNDTPPFPDDLLPGGSLSGFVVQTLVAAMDTNACAIASSDLSTTNAGSVFTGSVLAPSAPTLNPSVELSQNAGVLQLSVTGVTGFLYITQGSSNLTDWAPVATNSLPFVITIPTTKPAPRAMFYQALFPTTQD